MGVTSHILDFMGVSGVKHQNEKPVVRPKYVKLWNGFC